MPKPSKQIIIDAIIKEIEQGTKSIPLHGYYVYAILENNIVCYIGKGKRYRVLSHFRNSSNCMLASKIRENRDLFDWVVLRSFEDELETLDYEESVIKELKEQNIKLYNKVHYSSDRKNQRLFNSIFGLFHQYEQRIFPTMISQSTSLLEVVNILMNIIKEVCSKVKQENIPIYRSKKLNQLTFTIRPESDKNRVIFY